MAKEELFKNYYQNVERRFTILHLEIRKFDFFDWISLSLFAVSVSIDLILISETKSKFISSLFISGIIANFILATPFGIRFRNFYFSIIWFILSLIFLLNSTSFSKLPLLLFILYHILRLFFWKAYKKEFIPYSAGRGKLYRYVSKIEGRGGYKEDRMYMIIMILLGFVLFMYCLLESVGNS